MRMQDAGNLSHHLLPDGYSGQIGAQLRRRAPQNSRYDVALVVQNMGQTQQGPLQLLDAGLQAEEHTIQTLAFDAPRLSTPLLATAAKLLCVDDGLFDRKDGTEFARRTIRAARRAGRMVGLACVEPARVYRNRSEILADPTAHLDCIIGEPPAVLALFGVRRIDTLVPHAMRSGLGLIMHRVSHAPIFLRPDGQQIEFAGAVLSPVAFWSSFAPASIGQLISRDDSERQAHSEAVMA